MYARKSWIVLIAALALALVLAACGDGDEEEEAPPPPPTPASGNIVTQEFEFTDFTAVEVANAFVVDITQSDSLRVVVRVDDNVLDLVDVSKDGDTLTMRLSQPVRFTNVTLEASITMPNLERLGLSGATRAIVSGFQSTDPLAMDLSGASNLDGDLEAGSVDMEVSGASRVTLEGSAAELTVDGSGASSLDLTDFPADTASISLSGASEATVNVRDRIEPVDVSGASRLRYLGDPDLGEVKTSGASTVEKVTD